MRHLTIKKNIILIIFFSVSITNVTFPQSNTPLNTQAKNPILSFSEQWSLMQNEYQQLCSQAEKKDWLEYCHPTWQKTKKEINTLLNGLSHDQILNETVIRHMMVRTGFSLPQEFEFCYLKECISNKTKQKISKFYETDFGNFPREGREFNCTTNTLAQLFFAAKILERTEEKKIQNIVEFGGGFGSLARLMKQILPETTIFIIDLPELIAIQSLFLRSTVDNANIFVHKEIPHAFQEQAIHLIPVYLLNDLNITVDLFVSTFALSEGTEKIQSYIGNTKNFFNAKFLYLVGQINGWGSQNWANHTLLFTLTRSLYEHVDCQPFHLFFPESSQLSTYEIFAQN